MKVSQSSVLLSLSQESKSQDRGFTSQKLHDVSTCWCMGTGERTGDSEDPAHSTLGGRCMRSLFPVVEHGGVEAVPP